MTKQDDVFLSSEGDNWFNRNRTALSQKTRDTDEIISLIKFYSIRPRKVLEVGASNGYRLSYLNDMYQSEVYGVEPSEDAIRSGQIAYPFIKFQRATADSMKFEDHFFDLVIINFVFHWIDRDSLLWSCANIDKVLAWGGRLIIGDFHVPFYVKRKYHHITDQNIFTYKMPYKNIFLSTGIYKEIATVSYDHDAHVFTDSSSFQSTASITLLKKEDLSLTSE